MYLYLTLIIIPIVSCIFYFLIFPKRYYIAPIINLLLLIILTAITMPIIFEDIITGNYESSTLTLLYIFLPIQILSSLIFAGITYIIIKITKRDKSINKKFKK